MKKALKVLALVLSLCLVLSMVAFAGESEGGESEGGEMAMEGEGGGSEGESSGEAVGTDTSRAMNADATKGGTIFSITAEGLEINEEAGEYELTGEIGETEADGIDLVINTFTTNGFQVNGGEYTIKNSTIVTNVTEEVDANDGGGFCAGVKDGLLVIDNCEFTTNGKGGRNGNYTVDCESTGVMVVINSAIIQTGATGDPEGYTAAIADPPSNEALVISGYARANMSVGKSQTYYYGSYVETEGWAAMSTDSAQSGFAFYSYDSVGEALYGGYGTYADTSCVDWFYGSALISAEVGAIISNNGEIHMNSLEAADEAALAYLPEDYEPVYADEYNGRSYVAAGRNDFQLHSPDMGGSGAKSDFHAVLELVDTDIVTSEELDEQAILVDWSEDYGPALGEYVDFIKGANILVKSTGAYITLDDVAATSTSDVLLLTALNSDSMSRYALASDDMTGKGVELTIKNSEIQGDVAHFDYQRNCVVSLENTTWEGTYATIDKEAWDALWSDDCKADEACYWILDEEKYFTGEGTQSVLNIDATSVWYVTGESNLDVINTEAGAKILGVVLVDGEEVDVTVGGTWEGEIVVLEEAGPEIAEEAGAEEGSKWDAWIAYLNECLDTDPTFELYDQIKGELAAVTEADYTGMEDGTVFGVFAFWYGATAYEDYTPGEPIPDPNSIEHADPAA